MVEENISQDFRLKNIGKTRNYFFEEIEQNELMKRKHKKVRTTLNYTENFLILASCWMYFNFYCCFFAWYSYWNYEFCKRIKHLCNCCRNEKV